MKRLPIRGASIASPFRSEAELNSVLRNLGVAHAFEETAVHELYSRIGKVIVGGEGLLADTLKPRGEHSC
jgi:hypothetical protein